MTNFFLYDMISSRKLVKTNLSTHIRAQQGFNLFRLANERDILWAWWLLAATKEWRDSMRASAGNMAVKRGFIQRKTDLSRKNWDIRIFWFFLQALYPIRWWQVRFKKQKRAIFPLRGFIRAVLRRCIRSSPPMRAYDLGGCSAAPAAGSFSYSIREKMNAKVSFSGPCYAIDRGSLWKGNADVWQ